MDARECRAIGERLDLALAQAGLEIVVADRDGGNVVGFVPVAGEQVVVWLLRRMWILRPVGAPVPSHRKAIPAADSDALEAGRTLQEAARETPVLPFKRRGES